MNLPFMRGGTSTVPVNTPQLPPLPTVTQPHRLVELESSSSPAQPALEIPVSPRPSPNIARAMAMAQRLQSGTMTPEEWRTVYEAYRRNHPTLAQELSLMSRSNLLSWVPPDMKRTARRSKRQKIAQMLLEYIDGLFLRPTNLSTNFKEENRNARSEEQDYGRAEDQGRIAQPGLEPNLEQINVQPTVNMGIGVAQAQDKTLQDFFERKPEAEPLKPKKSIQGRLRTKERTMEQSPQGTLREFSDEVLAQKGERLRTTIVAEVPAKAIHKTPERSAIEAARDWVKQHITGPANTVIGEVEVDANAIQDSLSHTMYQNKLDALQAIVPVLEKGEYLGSLPDKDGKTINNFYFAGKVRIGEEEKIVFARTRKTVGHTNRLYVHEVFTEDDIKKTGASERVFTDTDRRFLNASEFCRSIIAKVFNVNKQGFKFPAGQQTVRQVSGTEQRILSSRSEDIEKRIKHQKPNAKFDVLENTGVLSLEKTGREVIDKPYSELTASFIRKTKKVEEGQQTEERPKQQPEEVTRQRDVNTHRTIKDSPEAKPFASLREDGPQAPDAIPVAVVDVDSGIVPEFRRARDLAKWLKNFFADKREETILSTGKKVRFGNSNLEASIKRVREEAHNQAYAGLNKLVRFAQYDSFEAKDARHPNLGGQEFYYSALQIGDTLYAVKLKFDIPSEAEIHYRKESLQEDRFEDLRYKDHTLREIEIAPVLYREPAHNKMGFTQTTEAIHKVTLGILRDAVKPSRLENGVLSSIKPGEFLSPGRRVGPHVRASSAQIVVNKLQEKAANAAETQVVQSFEELPEHIRQAYGDEASRLEGVYDPETGKVYLVADTMRGLGRVAEVWMHENLAHHGLNGLLGKGEKRRILNRLWQGMSGLGNADLKEIAHRYGVDPRSDADARELVMEKYIANLAEKRAADKLSGKEQTYWRRFVEAVLRAWNTVVDFVAGRTSTMRYENLDCLLAALDRYVFEGKPDSTREQGGMDPVRASVDKPGLDMEAAYKAWEQLQSDTAEWGRQLDTFAYGKANRIKPLQIGTTPDVLLRLGARKLPMQMEQHNLTKILSKHKIPLEILRDLPNQLANPLMVFKSATMADAYVVLTEMEWNGENLVAAIHFDVKANRVWANDVASIHDRSVEHNGKKIPGWVWIKGQIEKGNLRYYDKTRSPRWFRERAGLQLPSVVNLGSYRGVKILTEKDIVKPKPRPQKPLASLREKISEEAYPSPKSYSRITPIELKNDPDLALALKKLEEVANPRFGKGGMVFGRTGSGR